MSASGHISDLIVFLQRQIDDRRWSIIRAHDEIKTFERTIETLREKQKTIEETYGANPEIVDQIANTVRARRDTH